MYVCERPMRMPPTATPSVPMAINIAGLMRSASQPDGTCAAPAEMENAEVTIDAWV
jgi:hypothetical protein